MLEVKGLSKNFGALQVMRQVDFKLEPGERRVVLGPNGAGKTTFFNLIAGTLKPSAGYIHLAGSDITTSSVDGRARLGLARSYQKNNLFESLSIRENLALAAATAAGLASSLLRFGHETPEMARRIEAVAVQIGLQDVLDTPVAQAPYGHRRQLEVGLALACKPKLLLMDEPTSGVGQNMIDAFNRLIQALPRDLSVLIIEHDLDLAFEVADRITVLNHGEVVFEGTPDATRNSEVVRDIYLGDWQSGA